MDHSGLAEAFNRDGFVVLEEAFSGDELARISDEVDRVIAGKADYLPPSELTFEPGSNPPQVRNAFSLHTHSQAFLNAAKNPRVVAAMESILHGPLRLYASQVFAKPAFVGTVVPPHQDMPYWPFAPHEMVSAWIALDDSTIENGCVRHMAGSHKLGMLPHVPSGVAGNSLTTADDPRLKELREIPVEVKRGSCILHHCLTVHRSEPNQSAKPRRGLIFVYMSKNVQVTDASKLRNPDAVFPVLP